MKKPYTNFSIFASFLPRFIKPLNFVCAVSIQKYKWKEFFDIFTSFPLLFKNFFKFFIKVNRPGLIVFGFADFKPYSIVVYRLDSMLNWLFLKLSNLFYNRMLQNLSSKRVGHYVKPKTLHVQRIPYGYYFLSA